MPRLNLVICTQQQQPVFKAIALYKYLKQIDNTTFYGNDFDRYVRLEKHLSHIYEELDQINTNEYIDGQSLNKLLQWATVREEIISDSMFYALSEHPGHKSDIHRNILLCQREGIDCMEYIQSHSTSSGNCLEIDKFLGGAVDPATSQGIQNGLTLVLLVEDFLWKALNLSHTKPQVGMHDFLSPTYGMSGVKLTITKKANKMPSGWKEVIQDGSSSEGIDIPPGKCLEGFLKL